MTPEEAYDELAFYTLSHSDPAFIHQYVVDAFAAQYADENTKPIKVAFALMGLYLHLQKGYTGREVQLAHMQVAKKKQEWPVFELPVERGAITSFDVLKAEPGLERDQSIEMWMRSVWDAWKSSHAKVSAWVDSALQKTGTSGG